MTPNASKQGNFGSLGAIFLFIFLPCMWGLGFQRESWTGKVLAGMLLARLLSEAGGAGRSAVPLSVQ